MRSWRFRKKIDHLARLGITQLLASFLLNRLRIALQRLDLRIQPPVFLVRSASALAAASGTLPSSAGTTPIHCFPAERAHTGTPAITKNAALASSLRHCTTFPTNSRSHFTGSSTLSTNRLPTAWPPRSASPSLPGCAPRCRLAPPARFRSPDSTPMSHRRAPASVRRSARSRETLRPANSVGLRP